MDSVVHAVKAFAGEAFELARFAFGLSNHVPMLERSAGGNSYTQGGKPEAVPALATVDMPARRPPLRKSA